MRDMKEYIRSIEGSVLMAHLVSGYPDRSRCLVLAERIINCGVDILEVQIPFSDPPADGPTIMNACEVALQDKSTPMDAIDLVRSITAGSSIPVVIMTYFNIILNYGISAFAADSSIAGSAGLIIPDLPLDSPEGEELIAVCYRHGLNLIPVVSPGMTPERLAKVVSLGTGFIYATLKVGITGSPGKLSSDVFLDSITQICDMPVLAGFGISSVEEAVKASRKADGVVIGSHLIRLFEAGGISSLSEFVTAVSANLHGKESI